MSETARRRAALAAITATLTLTWCWLLPMLGRADAVRRQIQRSQRLGINPAAIYYTDVFEPPIRNSEVNHDAIDHRR